MEISVSKGQGITQAIASNLGLNKDDCKGIKLSTWQSVMTLVDEANTTRLENNQTSIFTGGNDVSSIGDKSSWKSNFHVNAGDVMQIDDSIFARIKELLTGKAEAPAETEAPAAQKAPDKADAPAEAAEETPAAEVTSQGKVNEVESEDGKRGQEIDKKIKEMGEFGADGKVKDISLDITGDEWRALAGKKDKTAEEKQQLDTQYKSAVKNAGFAYHAFIDEKFGNNDGVIDEAEYTAFEDESVPDELRNDEEAMAQIKEMSHIAFNRLDLNKDGKIDYEEISAYLHAMDFGTEDGKSKGLNGKISAYDFMVNSLALSKEEKSSLDDKLKYAYNALFGKKAA